MGDVIPFKRKSKTPKVEPPEVSDAVDAGIKLAATFIVFLSAMGVFDGLTSEDDSE